ncbi:DUF885 domain-containing protein [Marinagarivorans algicola]|uniref:DUF885 domain-containing protein n=1 Tax=Marinagarivorans algicola TaxID=1513270 RepID=UPI0006B88641|nr:DUF885 domain-containing protein [Marinagarivorans algicola]
MHRLPLSLFIALALPACSTQESSKLNALASETAQPTATSAVAAMNTETQKMNAWFEAQYETELLQSPIALTFQGRKERYGEIDDMSEAGHKQRLEWKRKSVEEMRRKFDREKLTSDGKLSYDLWALQYEDDAAGEKFIRNHYIFEQMQGVHSFLPTLMMSFHNVESASDMDAYVSRLSQIGRAMDQLIEQAQLNAQAGVRPPRFAFEIVTKEAKDIISGQPFDSSDKDSSLWANAKEKVAALVEAKAISQTQAKAYLASAKAALTKDFQPAYQRLIAHLEADIKNTPVQAVGVSALPNGDAYYAYLLKSKTTTDMTADEIHDLGLSEVKRLRGEMEKLKSKSGFKGTLQEFFAYIRDSRDDERFYFTNDDAGRQGYIDEATAAIDNIKKELPNYFGILPKADLEVRRVESFREQDGAPQHYYSGTPDGSRPGIYYAHLSDMKAMPKNELEVIAYHEGLPGHHMQISIAQELTGIPTFRTQAGFTAYAEGWALYSEALAREMPGTFENVYSDFGRLGSEIWRAIRLVVDTGMHHKGWSQQQAVDYFSSNSPAPLAAIEAEIRRYLVIPGQATTYKIGMIRIQQLRQLAEKELGDKFDIRAFHDTILDGGALPMSMLERKVKTWIASQK